VLRIPKARGLAYSKNEQDSFDFYAKDRRFKSELTIQIVREFKKLLGTEDVACVIDAKHLCVRFPWYTLIIEKQVQ